MALILKDKNGNEILIAGRKSSTQQTNTLQATSKKAQPPKEDSEPTTKEVLNALLGVTP